MKKDFFDSDLVEIPNPRAVKLGDWSGFAKDPEGLTGDEELRLMSLQKAIRALEAGEDIDGNVFEQVRVFIQDLPREVFDRHPSRVRIALLRWCKGMGNDDEKPEQEAAGDPTPVPPAPPETVQ